MTRLTRTRVAVTTGLTLTTAGLGLALAPAALAESFLPEMTGSHSAVVGQPHSLSGVECDATKDGEDATVYVDYYTAAGWDDPDGLPAGGVELAPADDGTWTSTFTFPADSAPGTYVAAVTCEPYTGSENPTFYPEFDVALAAAPATSTPTTPAPPTTTSTPAATPGAIRGTAANTPGVAPAASSATTTATPAPGQKVVKVYKGFKPGEKVTLTMHSTPITLGVFTADANGVVTVTFTVPAGAAAGTHTLVLEGDMGTYFQEDITVAAALTTAGSAGLAYTGADVAVPLALGAGLLVVGGGALVASRRRTGATQA